MDSPQIPLRRPRNICFEIAFGATIIYNTCCNYLLLCFLRMSKILKNQSESRKKIQYFVICITFLAEWCNLIIENYLYKII
jgi:hypothetical protein